VRELAVQSASGTYQDATDRAYMQTEVDELTAQIDQVITNTKFNGVELFDGSTATVTVQTGADGSDTVDLAMADLTTLAAAAARPVPMTFRPRPPPTPCWGRSTPSLTASIRPRRAGCGAEPA
jgi:hypothetical protein